MGSSTFPALHNSKPLNLPSLLDFHLQHNPDFPLFIYNGTGSTQTTEIKMLEFIRATHRVGKAILSNSRPGDVVAIVANLDTLQYSTLITGIIKAGLVPFPISPRNSPMALLNLIRKTSAHRVITTRDTLRGVIDGLQAELDVVDPSYAISIEEAPSLQEIYPQLGKETAQDPFTPLDQPFSPKDSDNLNAIYLHSSGSTGLPKHILLTHKIIKNITSLSQSVRICSFRRSTNPWSNHSVHSQDTRIIGKACGRSYRLSNFPYDGTCFQVLSPLYGIITTAILPPTVTKPGAIPVTVTPETVLDAAKVLKPTFMITVPTFLHTWAQSDNAVEFLRTLNLLMFGGGPIAPSVAESLISRGVPIISGYGGTEFGVVSDLIWSKDSWQYIRFMEEVHIRWIPQGDGTFEAQFLTCETHYVAVENLPDVPGYSSQDLFEPHPTIPNLWKIVGRVDDVLIHSSGEKTAEWRCHVWATTRLLVEPLPAYQIDVNNQSEKHPIKPLNRDAIESANRIAPAFSRIFKDMILVVGPEKPLPRVAKGTVARKASFALYDAEINGIYETVASNPGDSIEPPESWEAKSLAPWLTGQISDILSTKTLPVTTDLFEHGLDSLSSAILRLRIVGALRKSGHGTATAAVTQNLIYSHPTISQLTHAVAKLVADPYGAHGTRFERTHEEAIEDVIAKYSEGLDAPLPRPANIHREKQYVLLTGSTGNLGAQLLVSLLLDNSVARVYVLNRPSASLSMADRHLARFQDKSLDTSMLFSPKLVFLSGETSHENLGLSEEIISELRHNLTMVIHNAWKLDFKLTLPSFESHVKGSRALIDLARSSRHSSSVRFLFTSSIGSTQSWNAQTQGPYPEHVVMEAKYAVGAGYGESKYVTERILAKSGLNATSFRIGQVTGGEPNGAWATSDWVPIIVKSSLSLSLNMLPDAVGFVSWMPMDAVSNALLDVGFSNDLKAAPMAVNVVHPNPVSWTSVVQSIRTVLIQEKNLPSDALPLVPFHDWLVNVEQRARESAEAATQNIPAIKLVEFLREQANADDALRQSNQQGTESVGLTTLSTVNVRRLSPRTRDIKSLNNSLIEKWVRYWIKAGF
ncbi:hypothetical protein D9757_000419 [Collybiopsis confluens]|uniref:Uncharacterized protein n=1 Tax=Collybiopsis confluens TaxID=2823264 RepID=A0A8H5I2Q1_9AGAR|nr:hypothetical protein D9757_000419 [Collybiopsis confluens]